MEKPEPPQMCDEHPADHHGCRDLIGTTEATPQAMRPAVAPMDAVDVVLAPLCGITDSVFRRMCLDQGADMVVTEMISSEGLVRNSNHVRAIRELNMAEGPLSLQIFGSDPEVMGEAAAILSELQPRFLDMNFGCPVKKIVSKNGGSAVLKDPRVLHKICKRVVERSSAPVSAKIRSGWDRPTSENIAELGSAIEDAGVSMVAIHARTRKQAFQGKANWELIRQLKEVVSIPVIGNGDVTGPESYFKIKEETGCDAVMIGRCAIGNPWIFDEIRAAKEGRDYVSPAVPERVRVLLDHVTQVVDLVGERNGLVLTRKIMAAYLKRMPNARELRGKLMQCEDLVTLKILLDEYLDGLDRFRDGGAADKSSLEAAC